MKRTLLVICLVSFYLANGFAQPPTYNLIQSIETEATDIQTDVLGNFYLIEKASGVEKYDRNGQLKERFEFIGWGILGNIDVSNPLKLLLYFPDVRKIVTLNSNLSLLGEYTIDQFLLSDVSAVGAAHDNLAWIFDLSDQKLKKINRKSEVIVEGITRMGLDDELKPQRIIEDEGLVYCIDTNRGLTVYDIYGTGIEFIPIKHFNTVRLINNEVLFLQAGNIFKYDRVLKEQSPVVMPIEGNVEAFGIEKNRMYILKQNRLFLYRF